jgi:hypothetical protein
MISIRLEVPFDFWCKLCLQGVGLGGYAHALYSAPTRQMGMLMTKVELLVALPRYCIPAYLPAYLPASTKESLLVLHLNPRIHPPAKTTCLQVWYGMVCDKVRSLVRSY